MAFTTSIHIQESINHTHNTDKTYRERLNHTHNERINDNIVLLDAYGQDDEKSVQKRLILAHKCKNGQTIEQIINDYNKDKRDDRKTNINKLFDKQVKAIGKNKVLKQSIREQEMIVQIGNMFTNTDNLFTNNPLEEKDQIEILTETFERIKDKYKNDIEITQATIHVDETTPHMHIDYLVCQYDENKKRGIKLNFSNGKFADSTITAERKQEIKNESNNVYEYNSKVYKEFHNDLTNIINEVANERGFEIDNPNISGRSNLDTKTYKNFCNEISKLNDYEKLQEQVNQLQQQNNYLTNRIEKICDKLNIDRNNDNWFNRTITRIENFFNTEKENKSLLKENETLKENNKVLQETNNEYEQNLYSHCDTKTITRMLNDKRNKYTNKKLQDIKDRIDNYENNYTRER